MRTTFISPIFLLLACGNLFAQSAASSAQSAASQPVQRDATLPIQSGNTTTNGASTAIPSSSARTGMIPGGQASKQTYEAHILAAQQQVAIGDYATAETGFEQARDAAREIGDSTAEANSSLSLAKTIEFSTRKAPLDQANLERVQSAYKDAIARGDANQQAAAHNGLALTLSRQGNAAGALEELKAINLQQLEPAKRAVYRYNLASTDEKLGNWQQAYDTYLAAMVDKPEYTSASESAFRLLRSRPEAHLDEAVKLTETLLSTGQITSAEKYTKQYLDLWGKEPGSQQLLAALLDYYTVAPLKLETLQTTEWEYLQHLATSAPILGQPISDVRIVCFENFNPIFDPYQAHELMPAWANQEWQRRAMSGMLKKAADLFRQQGNFREALARYSAAWALSGDAEAALYAASLLQEQRQLIDTNQQLFNQLLQGIFAVKGIDYGRQDWPNILRLHTVLGTIFEQEKKWGSESDSHSAIFQWRHAISAEEQIRRTDANFPRSPMLYSKLANAYRETGNSPAALDLYLSAAEGFLEASNPREAKIAMKQAQSLDVRVPPAAEERMRKIDLSIHALSPTSAELKSRGIISDRLACSES